jgi:hypothetical protein
VEHAKNSFKFGRFTFAPVKRLPSKSLEISVVTPHLRRDRVLNLSTYVKTYAYEGFYEACGEKYYDLFRCEENGRIYIPCQNELFEYV